MFLGLVVLGDIGTNGFRAHVSLVCSADMIIELVRFGIVICDC